MADTVPSRSESGRKHRLSKSRYCTGVQCLKALYLRIHRPELAAPIDPARQMIFDQGTAVGVEARKRYPGGKLIEQDHLHSQEALKETEEAVKLNVAAIFEAAFYFHNTLVRIDVLRSDGQGGWEIIEVKSSTKVKDEHIPDLAIQRYVAEGAGLKISKTFLKHLNSDCVFPNLENLFLDVDCTERVNAELSAVRGRIEQMLSTLQADHPPPTEIGPHCKEPYECDFQSTCWAHIPEHSVFELNGVWDSTKFALFQRGIVRIADIPDGERVSRAKAQQLTAVRTKSPVIDLKGLAEFLDSLQYPLYFFDFETIDRAIPRYEGLSPYSQMPFQYSCHVIESRGAQVKHLEYLADGSKDPRSEIVERLLRDLGTSGTILAYNQTFEKTRIKELAGQFPGVGEELRGLLPRFRDLRDAFAKYYYHPGFRGSLSIKDVLPVLVPSLSYEGLGVGDGDEARVVYLKLCDSGILGEERARCRKDLLEYCRLDTLAMVELLRCIQGVVDGGNGAVGAG